MVAVGGDKQSAPAHKSVGFINDDDAVLLVGEYVR
jgi:hypothetical protein